MGALSLIIYNSQTPVINMDFTTSFSKMINRGQDDTSFCVEKTISINKMNENNARMHLSRREIAEYKPFTFMYGYHRMAVNDITKDGAQPFEDPIIHQIKNYHELRTRPKRSLICNGEIYNYKKLVERENFGVKDLQSTCDVEVILPLYIKYGIQKVLEMLDGDYSFALLENTNTFDLKTLNVFVARDVLGIKPLYMIKSNNDIFYMFVSELKGVPDFIFKDAKNYSITEVPPGSFWSFQNSIVEKNNNEFIRYSDWNFYKSIDNCTIKDTNPQTVESMYADIKTKLTSSVVKRYASSNVSVGVLLSGGFDSSIIMSILVKYLVSIGHDFKAYPVCAFTTGTINGSDVKSAQKVVEHLENLYNVDIIHHIVTMDDVCHFVQEVNRVVYILETYDTRSIQGAIPLSFICKYIKEKTNVKVLLTGEGLDELCGYHQLFSKLSDEEFQRRSVRLIKNLSKYDILRADKISSSYGLEVRHPFLDTSFVEYILSIHPKLKRPQVYKYNKPEIEKYIVRKAFDDNYLPHDVLWRSLQDVSDSFTNFKVQLQKYFDLKYTDSDLYAYNTNLHDDSKPNPTTKEAMHYKKVFESTFPNVQTILPRYWEDNF